MLDTTGRSTGNVRVNLLEYGRVFKYLITMHIQTFFAGRELYQLSVL